MMEGREKKRGRVRAGAAMVEGSEKESGKGREGAALARLLTKVLIEILIVEVGPAAP